MHQDPAPARATKTRPCAIWATSWANSACCLIRPSVRVKGSGDPKDGGSKGLSKQQSQLQGELGNLVKKAGKNPAQDALNRAEKLMGDAAQALAMEDLPRAGTLQKDVLDALRKAADSLASSQGQQGKGPRAIRILWAERQAIEALAPTCTFPMHRCCSAHAISSWNCASVPANKDARKKSSITSTDC